ncbi:two-component system response regulator CssR [Gracilibacillus halophilus YIM-C55.5]|uniref:Two-component system response regulator CssR n=1 Tax=Gracilibacillus halophilus YIM-C55.5 TaxID=1308866 RepID=N4WJM6_9BACI|nr:response regulator transcription factor [Gracilibacillus halophilus]ENH96372.1 two-component system response regulator CssR [Gracilibacillus halophilus YIM-C55.5]
MSQQIYIVEDDPNIRDIVKAYLTKEGYQVTLMERAEDAWAKAKAEKPDMWILDIMLPGMDGYELCKNIREVSEVPIIIISAKDEEVDKILGLELGSDDYLTKPFSPRELVARIKRLFKRASTPTTNKTDEFETIEIDALKIDQAARQVFWQDAEIDVTSKEFEMLEIFAKNANRAFSRDELLTLVWGDDYFGSDRAVDDLIKRLRKKLDGLPVETVWGYGYRLHIDEESK